MLPIGRNMVELLKKRVHRRLFPVIFFIMKVRVNTDGGN